MNITPGRGKEGNVAQGVKKLVFQYGRSVSAVGSSTDVSSSANTKFQITLNGDGPHEVTLPNTPNLKTGNEIAVEIQRQVRRIRATDSTIDRAFSQFVCDYNGEADRYVLVSGEPSGAVGATGSSTIVITDAAVGNIASELGLGIANGGVEDTFFPRQNRFAEFVELCTLPLPVELVGIDEVRIEDAQINVDLTHLDNEPVVGDIADSIRIGDGTETLSISPENAANVETENAGRTPAIFNETVLLANTEQSFAIPAGTKRYQIKVRSNRARVQISYTSGQSGTTFFTLEKGRVYEEKSVILNNILTLYFQVSKANQVLEIKTWS